MARGVEQKKEMATTRTRDKRGANRFAAFNHNPKLMLMLSLARTEQMISVQEPAKIDIKTTIMLLFSSLNSSSNFKAPASHTTKVRKN